MAGRYRRATTPEQRAKAAEARDAKLSAMHDTLAKQVATLASGPEWRQWLDVAARFHSYSFNNTLLLLAQKPEATHVAGYQLWQQLGRQVTKGERGLTILAPVTRKVDPDEDTQQTAGPDTATQATTLAAAGSQATGRRRVVAFRPAYVWDVTQTTGDPLPAQPRPELLAGQAPAGLWDALQAQCERAGFAVTHEPLAGDAGPNGYTNFKTHQVVVRTGVDDAQAVKTLAHELGHVLMHDPASFADGETRGCRGTVEVEAESVAYLVAADHGLDTSGYSFAYVAGWAASAAGSAHDSDAIAEAVRATGVRVLSTAHQVLDTSHAQLAGDPPPAAIREAATELADRAVAGAERTGALRQQLAEKPAWDPEPEISRDRLLAANDEALSYFRSQYATSWAPAYLEERLGTSLLVDQRPGVGYAPAGWTNLVDHLRSEGFTDAEVLGAGLGTRARTGRVVDRFRDRLMFPVRDRTADAGVEIVGFIGRRNPEVDRQPQTDLTGPYLNPKYLNTGQTAIWTKGDHLYGLHDAAAVTGRGGLAVLVEGPVDKLAVDLASDGMMVGVAALGTAVTDQHAIALRAALGDERTDRLVVATDSDRAGQRAAERAYDVLTRHGLDPRAAVLPAGLDPAAVHQQHGPAALVEPLATAGPLSRHLVDTALSKHGLTSAARRWAEDEVRASAVAAQVLVKAPSLTWQREIDAAAGRHGLDRGALMNDVAGALHVGDDALGRLHARDRRDDLDRGQLVPGTAVDVAALSTPRTARLQPPASTTPAEQRHAVPAGRITGLRR